MVWSLWNCKTLQIVNRPASSVLFFQCYSEPDIKYKSNDDWNYSPPSIVHYIHDEDWCKYSCLVNQILKHKFKVKFIVRSGLPWVISAVTKHTVVDLGLLLLRSVIHNSTDNGANTACASCFMASVLSYFQASSIWGPARYCVWRERVISN